MNRKEFNKKYKYSASKSCGTCKFMRGSYISPHCLRMEDLEKKTIGDRTFSMNAVENDDVCNLWEE